MDIEGLPTEVEELNPTTHTHTKKGSTDFKFSSLKQNDTSYFYDSDYG